MGASFLALNVGQMHTPMVQDLAGKLSFFGGDEHCIFGLSQQTTYVVEWAVWDVAFQPVTWSSGNPLAPDLVERVCQNGTQRLALRELRVHQLIPHCFPVLQHGCR